MPILGDRSTCSACQRPIEWRGESWVHLGEHQPRHIAEPVAFEPSNEPVELPIKQSMRPGPELNERVASEVAGWAIVRQYSTDIREAMGLADILVSRLDPSAVGLYNYPILVRTGHFGACWAASFDFNLDHEWYEHVHEYPFAARGESAAHALSLAMLKVAAVVKADWLKHRDDRLPRRSED